MYAVENKAVNRNIATLIVASAGKSDKIEYQNIAPGGDLMRPSSDIDPQVSPGA